MYLPGASNEATARRHPRCRVRGAKGRRAANSRRSRTGDRMHPSGRRELSQVRGKVWLRIARGARTGRSTNRHRVGTLGTRRVSGYL